MGMMIIFSRLIYTIDVRHRVIIITDMEIEIQLQLFLSIVINIAIFIKEYL